MYRNRQVLVTGGLGFIGSNLACRLVQLGARVTVVDPLVKGCGGNRHNIGEVAGLVRVVPADLRDAQNFTHDIASAEIIFNLAGEISHIHSMRFPERDAELNLVAQLRFLEQCARHNPGVRVVYASSRQIYGVPRYLPVDERHPIQAIDFNGVHKYAATAYHQLLTASGQLDAVVFCLTNVYGPRMSLDNPCQGFLGNFVRRAVTGQAIEIFGDGRQLRDPVYVDDVVQLFLRAGVEARPAVRLSNIGGAEVLSLARIAAMVSEAAGAPAPVFREFPEEHQAVDIGSYSTDSSQAQREWNWMPRIAFQDGMGRTIEYFRAHLRHYLDPDSPNPPCKLAPAPVVAVRQPEPKA